MSNPEIIVTVSEIGKKHRIQVLHRYEEGETNLLNCEDIDLVSWVPAQPFTSLVVVGDTLKLLKRADLLNEILDVEFQNTSFEFLDTCLPHLKSITTLSLVAAELPQKSELPKSLFRVILDNCIGVSHTTLMPRFLELRQPYTSQLPPSIAVLSGSITLFGLFPSTDRGVFRQSRVDPSMFEMIKTTVSLQSISLEGVYLEHSHLQTILDSGVNMIFIHDCAFESLDYSETPIFKPSMSVDSLHANFDSSDAELSRQMIIACPNIEALSARSRVLDENYFQALANIQSLSRVDMTDSTISRNVMTSLYQVEDVQLTSLRGISRKRAKKLFPNAIIDWN